MAHSMAMMSVSLALTQTPANSARERYGAGASYSTHIYFQPFVDSLYPHLFCITLHLLNNFIHFYFANRQHKQPYIISYRSL